MGTVLKLGWTRKYLRRMYVDVAVVRRYVEQTAEDGTVEMVVDTENAVEYPCRVSFSQQDTPDNTQEDISPKLIGVKLFFDVGVGVRKGDVILARKMGENGEVLQEIEGRAAEPSVYVNHVEVNLTENGAA